MHVKHCVIKVRAGTFIWPCCTAVCYRKNRTTHTFYNAVASRPHSVAKQTLGFGERRRWNNSAPAGERKEVIYMDLFCLPDRAVDLYGPELNRSTSGYSRT